MLSHSQVKLKYKMPFPIEVHSRKSDSHALQPPPAPPHVGSTEEVVAVASPAATAELEGSLAGAESVAGEEGAQESERQEFSFISIGELDMWEGEGDDGRVPF